MAFDGYAGGTGANDVEGIRFASATRGGRGAGLYYQCGVVRDTVARVGVTGMARMQMPGQQQIDPCHVMRTRRCGSGGKCQTVAVSGHGQRSLDGWSKAIIRAGARLVKRAAAA